MSIIKGNFGSNLRFAREARRLSVRGLVDALKSLGIKVDITTVYHWENNNFRPSLTKEDALKDFFGVESFDLPTIDFEARY